MHDLVKGAPQQVYRILSGKFGPVECQERWFAGQMRWPLSRANDVPGLRMVHYPHWYFILRLNSITGLHVVITFLFY